MSTISNLSPSERRSYIGGSEIGAILGISSFASRLDIWERKTGRASEKDPTVHMEVGTLLEDYVLADFEKSTGKKLEWKQKHIRTGRRNEIGGTIDGAVLSNQYYSGIPEMVVDAKVHSGFSFPHNDVPPTYYAQAQWYMHLCKCRLAVFHVLHFGAGKFKSYPVDYDAEFMEIAIQEADRFWDHVEQDVPPPPAPGDSITEWTKRMEECKWKGRNDGPAEVSPKFASEKSYKMIGKFKDIREEIKTMKVEEEKVRNRIIQEMGEARSLVDFGTGKIVVKSTYTKDGKFRGLKINC